MLRFEQLLRQARPAFAVLDDSLASRAFVGVTSSEPRHLKAEAAATAPTAAGGAAGQAGYHGGNNTLYSAAVYGRSSSRILIRLGEASHEESALALTVVVVLFLDVVQRR